MRKFIGTIVVILIIVVGFTGVNLKINDTGVKIPPFIKNVLNDKETVDKAKEVVNEAKDKIVEVVEDVK